MVTDAEQLATRRERKYNDLMKAGVDALAEGKTHLAHKLWREAATLDPTNERAWLALLKVVETEDDRRVCLQNIISINPENETARRRLREYQDRVRQQAEARAARRAEQRAKLKAQRTIRRERRRRSLVWRAVFVGMIAGVLGVLGGIIASILVYVF